MKEYIDNYTYVTDLEDGERQYDSVDLTEGHSVEARYVKVASDPGNCYIEALPKPRNEAELRVACRRPLVEYTSREKEIEKPLVDQILSITKLRQVRFQLPVNNELETEFYLALVNSYRMRNMVRDEDIQLPYTRANKDSYSDSVLLGSEADAANAGFSIVGYSGCGKSSALHTVCKNYPQVIIHRGKGMATYPQIVYLTVQCPPHSNFRGLYKNIGTAIDKALGNLKPVYSVLLDAGERGNLARYNDKVRELIEKFGIGIIIFDEIQHLSFNTQLENSFESLLELCNQTKVAFAVVGTEEVNEKLFSNLRQARRLGSQIHADVYCKDRTLFNFLAKGLFEYQWFDEDIRKNQPVFEEILDALYDCSKGIIDQLVGVYIYMNIDYVRRKKGKKPEVNAKYVRDTAEKHYPGIQDLLKEIYLADNEKKRVELAKAADQKLLGIVNEEREAEAIEAAKKSFEAPDTDVMLRMKNNIMRNILNVTGDYNNDTIDNAVNKAFNSKTGKDLLSAHDEGGLTRLTFEKLKSGRTDKRKIAPHTKAAESAITDFLFAGNDEKDDLLG